MHKYKLKLQMEIRLLYMPLLKLYMKQRLYIVDAILQSSIELMRFYR